MLRLDVDTQRAAQYLIRNLSRFEQNEALRPALTSAAKLFAARGRMNLAARIGVGIKHRSRSTGTLLRSITSAYRPTRKRGRSAMAVAGFRRGLDGGNHSHLVDSGTGPRYTKSGAYRGIMPANWFWYDARESEERKATEILYDAIATAVDRINSRRQ